MTLFLSSLVIAAPLTAPERPVFPFRSVAGEDGVHVMYQNPSLMSFDRDAMYGAYFETVGGKLNSLNLATTGAGLGAGVGFRQLDSGLSWWTVSSGVGVRLLPTVSLGSALHWQLPDGGDNNFVSWDLGLGFRPAPYLGLGAAVQNLGNPSPEQSAYTRYSGGVAVRPAGDLVTVGLDWSASAPPKKEWDHHMIASLRLRPTRGLWLRIYGDQSLSDLSSTELGAALEVHVARTGFGLTGRGNLSEPMPATGAYVTSVPKDDQLFSPGKVVAEFVFNGDMPYIPMPGGGQEAYLSMLQRLEHASSDPQVRGIFLHIDGLSLSYAQVEELRAIIVAARAEGKPVVAFLGQDSSTRAYFLATACDRVYLHPAAGLDLVGISAEIQYLKGAMDMVGIDAQYARRAEYKSGPEVYTRTGASDPAREEMNILLDDLYGAIVSAIATGRSQTAEEIRAAIDGGPYTGAEAVDKKLVDGLVYPDDMNNTLAGLFPEGFDRDDSYGLFPDTSGWTPQRAVAVVVVDGTITSGESSTGGLFGGGGTGSETVIQQLEQARRVDSVKAVVLRVDSPGGSAFASDEIWREVEKVKAEGKPVIVSMGGYAASGGYYVSAGADNIFALPSTVTGSIGVYGGKYSGEQLLETLHINTESYLRGRNAGMYSMTRPFDAVEFAALDRMIGETYSQFKDRVGDGRNMKEERVEEVARGRVWSGAQAQKEGLVDQLGGFFDAVDLARYKAGLTDGVPYSLITYNPWLSSGGSIPAYLIKNPKMIPAFLTQQFLPKTKLPPELEQAMAMMRLRNEYIYAMMPYRLEIR